MRRCRQRVAGQAVRARRRERDHRRLPADRSNRWHGMTAEIPQNNTLRKPVLVLNASYEPIHVCAVRRALVLLVKGVAHTEEATEGRVHSPSRSLAIPSVIRLLEYRRIPRQMRAHLAQEHPRPGPVHLPVLQQSIRRRGPDVGPCSAPFQGWCQYLGELGRVLPELQQPQGRPPASGSRHEPPQATQAIQPAYQSELDAPARKPSGRLAQVPILLRTRRSGTGRLLGPAPAPPRLQGESRKRQVRFDPTASRSIGY